jgi:hypothetical protein
MELEPTAPAEEETKEAPALEEPTTEEAKESSTPETETVDDVSSSATAQEAGYNCCGISCT